jgi:uncharacterized RDD family membrane protein YckC
MAVVDDTSGGTESGPTHPSEPTQDVGAPAQSPPQPAGWTVGPAAPVEIAPGLVFGSTLRRFAAYVLDTFIIGLALYLIYAIMIAVLLKSTVSAGVIGLVVVVVGTGMTFAYFVGTWRSRGRATPGMRLFKLQIGNAFDGRTLTLDQAIRRWVAMGFPLTLLAVIPVLASAAGLANLVLDIVLLITTIGSQTKQGLHDRFANSAVVEPAGLGFGAVLGCILIVVVVLPLIAITAIIALLFLGGQVSKILSTVGTPAP